MKALPESEPRRSKRDAVATKAAAQAVGVDLGNARAPYGPLSADKQDELTKLIAETGLNYA